MLYTLLLVILFLVVFILVRTMMYSSPRRPVLERKSGSDSFHVKPLQLAINCRTISHQEEERVEGEEFLALHRYLEESFPLLHQSLSREVITDYSLLYTWEGRDPQRRPILLLAHMDVVPADDSQDWTHPPFQGVVHDAFIWGRGALDNKGNVVAQLQAVEALLESGFQPETTIYLAFGHDEEVGGEKGAGRIAQYLKEKGVQLQLVLDEGGVMVDSLFAGLHSPLALVGIAEKGYLTVKLEASAKGGHSATPPSETAIGILAAALRCIEKKKLPLVLDDLSWAILHAIGPHLSLRYRIPLANTWLFSPLIRRMVGRDSSLAPLFRTTLVPTMICSGVKENVIPSRAQAVMNSRLRPGDTAADVLAYLQQQIDHPGITVRLAEGSMQHAASPISQTEIHFPTIERMITHLFPGTVVAPYLVFGATDSRYFWELTDSIYRFSPFLLKREDLKRIHGIDERLGILDYKRGILFYQEFLQTFAGEGSQPS